ncbi:MAG: VCBS repeat-containing protein [Pirellulaceae bacterium]
MRNFRFARQPLGNVQCAVIAAVLAFPVSVCAGDRLHEPVLIVANERPLDVGNTGNSSPFVADFDGDGIKDLLVGQHRGTLLRVYRNLGSNAAPKFGDYHLFRDGDTSLSPHCSMIPQLVDLNGDGRMDLLTDGGNGTIAWFAGTEAGFSQADRLRRADGSAVRLRWLFSAFAYDWDRDGDLDVVCGGAPGSDYERRVFVLENVTTDNRLAFAEPDGGIELPQLALVPVDNQMPVVADWNNDGADDLVVGNQDGSVVWYAGKVRPEGEESSRAFDAPKKLVPPWEEGGQRGPMARICVVDWNEDGALDLLVGESGPIFERKLTDAEQQRVAEEKQGQGEDLRQWSKAYQEFCEHASASDLQANSKDSSLVELRETLVKLRERIDARFLRANDLQEGTQQHGRIWLFLRKTD